MRKDNPQLKAAADEFLKKNREGTLLGNVLINRYVRNFDIASNALSDEDYARFQRLENIFKLHSEDYGIPYLFAVAQGYQESRLNQSAKSAAGAIGIMQLLPSTANDKAVGIPDIHEEEKNIEAGIKYLVYLRDRYFTDPEINDVDKMLLSLAAYNAGPARIRQMRSMAEEEGYDPNVWFDNVEVITARVVGRETISYVTNIYRYYLTYGMVAAKELERRAARREVGM
jgi:membrane-bound lytic murein transglycosylase MltF